LRSDEEETERERFSLATDLDIASESNFLSLKRSDWVPGENKSGLTDYEETT
jgi:hypothetical protein